jgi:hypothetical protein
MKRFPFAAILAVIAALILLGQREDRLRLVFGASPEGTLTFVLGRPALALGVWELHQNKMATRVRFWQDRNQLEHFSRACTPLGKTSIAERRRVVLARLGKDSLMEICPWTIHRYHREHQPGRGWGEVSPLSASMMPARSRSSLGHSYCLTRPSIDDQPVSRGALAVPSRSQFAQHRDHPESHCERHERCIMSPSLESPIDSNERLTTSAVRIRGLARHHARRCIGSARDAGCAEDHAAPTAGSPTSARR